ncbi:MAG: DUF2993 domain-containing protein [Cyanophyceae cyanobacterium]
MNIQKVQKQQQTQTSLGKKAINKAVEIGLSSQVEAVENLDIDIDCEPIQLAEGEVNSVKLRGEDIVMPQNLSVAEILLETDHVAINVLKAALGKVELSQPTDASLRILLEEADLNRALQSDYLRDLIAQLTIPVGEQNLNLKIQQGKFELSGQNRVSLEAQLLAQYGGVDYDVEFAVTLLFEAFGKRIIFEGGRYLNGKSLDFSATIALLTKVNDLLKLRTLQLSQLLVQIERIYVAANQITLELQAHVEQIPEL